MGFYLEFYGAYLRCNGIHEINVFFVIYGIFWIPELMGFIWNLQGVFEMYWIHGIHEIQISLDLWDLWDLFEIHGIFEFMGFMRLI